MATDFVPQDEASRQRIRHSLDETLFVEAGAGTGKTTSLVDRVYGLVTSGRTTLDRIAAITFNEAAAAELRDRVRERFEQAANDGSLGQQERDRVDQGISDIDLAWIQTLHSFAARLLRERPLEAGLPPAFETRDEITGQLAFDEVWQRWLDDILEDPNMEETVILAISLGLKLDHLKVVARKFHDNYDLLGGKEFQDLTLSYPSMVRSLDACGAELQRLCTYSKLGSEDPLYDHVDNLIGVIDRLRDFLSDESAGYRLLARSSSLKFSRGRQGDWDDDPQSGINACKLIKELLTELQDRVDEELFRVRQGVLVPLVRSLQEAMLNYARQRKQEGQAEFHDLLVWARDLLRDDLQVRDHFRGRFSHLLIDEVQDTDPIQTEIAMFLAEKEPSVSLDHQRPRHWKDVEPKTGKLFIVGDPKQSIYRFRRADIRQMLELRDHLGIEPVRLQQNFRSHKVILSWVNEVFAQWMQSSDSQSEYVSLSHRWGLVSKHPARPRVWRLGGEMDDSSIRTIRQEEAKAIAAQMTDIVNQEWQVLDTQKTAKTGAEHYRQATYSDICVLMPTRTGLDHLELAMDRAGIPYRLEGASLVFATQEIKDLTNCLRSIDDSSDQVALVAALRSPAFSCSDLDLLRFVNARGKLSYQEESIDEEGPVSESLDVLQKYHADRLWISVPFLIDRFIRDRMLMESALGNQRYRQQWRRYRFLVEQARAFEQAGGNSLRGFLDWIDQQTQEGVRVTEIPVPETDEETVRIMTVHGSKGLEFPVVILTGLNVDRNSGAGGVVFDRDSGEINVSAGVKDAKFETPGYSSVEPVESEMTENEYVRLLYVASTRARDHLVLSVYRKSGDDTSAAARIPQLLDGKDELWTETIPSGLRRPRPIVESSGTNAPPSYQDFQAWELNRQQLVQRQGVPYSVAATTLVSIDKEESHAEEPWKRGRGGTSIGRAVHAVLETVDLNTGEDLDDVSSAQAAAEGIPHRQTEIARLVRTAMESKVVRRAVNSKRLWREVPVGVPLANGVLEGFIDLLFEEEGGLVIVDYKTDSLDAEDTEGAAERYRLQGGAYALALERATGLSVKEVVFLFLRPRREESLKDVDVLTQEALQAAVAHLGSVVV